MGGWNAGNQNRWYAMVVCGWVIIMSLLRCVPIYTNTGHKLLSWQRHKGVNDKSNHAKYGIQLHYLTSIPIHSQVNVLSGIFPESFPVNSNMFFL